MKRIVYLDYYGLVKCNEYFVFPEGAYVVMRYDKALRLLELCHVECGKMVHIGTIDLNDILEVAGKSHMAILKKDEFYDVLDHIFEIDLRGKLYAMADVEFIFKQVAYYSKLAADNADFHKRFVSDDT